MNSNLQNATPLAARPEDPEKALLAPPGPPSYYAVYHAGGAEALPQDHRRAVRRRRFWHFTACAILLLMFWRPLVDSVASVVYKHLNKHTSVDPHWAHEIMASPSDCADTVNWRLDPVERHSDWPYHAHASLALPIDAEELFFKAEGSRAHGTFEVSQSRDVGTDAVVDIDVAYRSENALAEATVCHLHPSENKHGLGIFTERWHHPENHRQLRFHVHVRLPATRYGEARTINAFNTDLPMFTHHLAELADTVLFKSIHLHTSNAGLRADSLKAVVGTLKSSNGKIEGVFNTSDSLELRTSNAPIHVTANLLNTDKDAGTVLVADTSNGAIQAHVGLFADSVDGAFRVDARTNNAPARVTITNAPANSLLNASAVSSNAPVSFEAHAAFEGTFELHSTWFSPPTVEEPHPVEDPLGKGRRRTVQVNNINRGAIRGQVGWEPKHEKAKSGHVGLETSNARATLFL